jgi:signal peptidase I
MDKIIFTLLICVTFLLSAENKDRIEKGFFETGELEYTIPYKNNQKHGIAKLYFITGELKRITPLKNDKINGLVKTYYKNGILESEIPYVNDLMNGIGKKYYKSGKLLSETTLKNNKTNGIARAYYESGELEEEIYFNDFKREGITKKFNKDGTIKSKTFYKNGKKITNDKDESTKNQEISKNFDLGIGKKVYIKNYDDLIKATKDLNKPIDQRWIFLDNNDKLVRQNDPDFIKYFHKYYYHLLDNNIEILTKYIPTGAMKNTIYNNETILVFKGFNKIFRAGVFAFDFPKDPNVMYIKRCVAIGGDIIFIKDKILYLHPFEGNQYVQQKYKNYETIQIKEKIFVKSPYRIEHKGIHNDPNVNDKNIKNQFPQLFNTEEILIPKGECFMMGDNRDHSNDSRFWGNVPQEFIVGVVVPIKLKSNNEK